MIRLHKISLSSCRESKKRTKGGKEKRRKAIDTCSFYLCIYIFIIIIVIDNLFYKTHHKRSTSTDTSTGTGTKQRPNNVQPCVLPLVVGGRLGWSSNTHTSSHVVFV